MTPLFTGLTCKMGTMASVQHALGLETAQKAAGAGSISMNTTSLPSLSSVLSSVKGGGGGHLHLAVTSTPPPRSQPLSVPPALPQQPPRWLPQCLGSGTLAPGFSWWVPRFSAWSAPHLCMAESSSYVLPREVLPGDPSQSVHLTAVTQSPHYGSSNLRRHISCWCICSLMYLLSAPI